MPFTIAQVSDSHLGTGGQRFRANFDRVVAALGAVRPDVVVASGDLSYDGVGTPGDLALAAAAFAGMPAPVHAIPGNHDVGDHPELSPNQPVTDLALRRFREVMGRDRWVIDRDDWRLIGLDSQIMGAHPEQDAQAAMVAEAVATLGGRRLAVFSHKPLFLIDPDDTSFDYWSVPPAARRAVMPILEHPALRLVASGHLHMLHLGAYTLGLQGSPAGLVPLHRLRRRAPAAAGPAWRPHLRGPDPSVWGGRRGDRAAGASGDGLPQHR